VEEELAAQHAQLVSDAIDAELVPVLMEDVREPAPEVASEYAEPAADVSEPKPEVTVPPSEVAPEAMLPPMDVAPEAIVPPSEVTSVATDAAVARASGRGCRETEAHAPPEVAALMTEAMSDVRELKTARLCKRRAGCRELRDIILWAFADAAARIATANLSCMVS
jgi:hypothetical protein